MPAIMVHLPSSVFVCEESLRQLEFRVWFAGPRGLARGYCSAVHLDSAEISEFGLSRSDFASALRTATTDVDEFARFNRE
jgi:hypothetical protein